jgi:hypothetical protein
MRRPIVTVCFFAMLAAATVETSTRDASARQGVREGLCGAEDRTPGDVARQLEPLGESGRVALMALAASPNASEVMCGVAGLASLRDRRAIPLLEAALRNPAMRGKAHLLARWAAFLAGGPDPDLGAAMLTVVEAVTDRGVWSVAGHDAIWFLGEVDHPAARDRLVAELDQPLDDAGLDAVVHALARQGDPRERGRIAAVGLQAAREKSGNATPEQARRLGAVAFYQLALGPETLADGIATLGTIAARDQEDAAAWAVHTLRARRPATASRRPSKPISGPGQARSPRYPWHAAKGTGVGNLRKVAANSSCPPRSDGATLHQTCRRSYDSRRPLLLLEVS